MNEITKRRSIINESIDYSPPDEPEILIAKDGAMVRAIGGFIVAREGAHVIARNDTFVLVQGEAFVTLTDDTMGIFCHLKNPPRDYSPEKTSYGVLCGNALAEVYGNNSVTLNDNSRLIATSSFYHPRIVDHRGPERLTVPNIPNLPDITKSYDRYEVWEKKMEAIFGVPVKSLVQEGLFWKDLHRHSNIPIKAFQDFQYFQRKRSLYKRYGLYGIEILNREEIERIDDDK